jgi:nucleoside-diphosphate-sugar epimerase
MRVFLAGATGVIGRSLVPALVAGGHQVTGLVRREAQIGALKAQGAEAVLTDVYDAAALTAAVIAARPDVVMHQLTDLGRGNFAANSAIRKTGTRNLVDAALAAGARRVIAQSIAWAYEGGDSPAVEGTPLDLGAPMPRQATVEGVAALERIVAELPEWVVLRYGTLYGPGTWYSKGGPMDDRVRAGELVPNSDVNSFLRVEDAAAAAVQALDWPTGPVNIVDDEPAAAAEWIPAFARSIGAPEPASVDTVRTPWARGADNRHARDHLHWTPQYPTWREGFLR